MIRALVVVSVLCLAPPAMAASLPQAMRGTWGYESVSCTAAQDDGRVEIGRDTVAFFAAHCTIESHARLPDGTLAARGRCRGEGEETAEPGRLRLRRIGRSRLFIAQDGGAGHVYRRCPHPIPVR